MRYVVPTVVALTCSLVPGTNLAAQNEGRPVGRTFQIRPAPGPIELDGVLDEQAWTDAEAIPLLWEWFPGDNTPPPVETVCRVTYDDRNFYFACHALDPDPGAIRAHLADRDDLRRTPQDDHIVILLDPFNDERRAFQFRVNPLGVQMDAVLSTAEGFEDFSWDAIWGSTGKITADGYVVEAAIPFKSLRFPRSQRPQTWGIIMERSYPRSNRHRIRSMPTDRNNVCLLCQANKITGLEGITPGLNVEVAPTLTSSRTDRRANFPSGNLESGDIDASPGLDLRWGITPNLPLNLTVNPDFSQVEADVAQLDVNTRFALFFPEKRPFFLEGADFFETPLDAVFTRTVADPRGGGKLTGKAGRWGIGTFAANDRQTNLIFPANEGSDGTTLDQSATTGVARLRRDIGGSSYLGGLYAGRVGDGYQNHVGGADLFWQFSRSNTVRAQYLISDTDYPDSTAMSFGQPDGRFMGGAFSGGFQHFSRNWAANLEYTDRSPNFRSDVGFTPRVDTRIGELNVRRVFWGSRGSWFTQLGVGAFGASVYDHDGQLTDRTFGGFLFYLGPNQLNLSMSASRNRERLRGIDHDLTDGEVFFEIRPSGSVLLRFVTELGDEVDVANNRKGFSVTAVPLAQFSLGRPITLNLSHVYQRLWFQGEHVFTANLFQATTFYHFSTRMFVRAIVQFQDVRRNVAEFPFPVDQKAQRLFGQFLFSYKVNPQTVAFVGYSDTRLGTQSIDITQRDRTFFVKLGYAWRP